MKKITFKYYGDDSIGRWIICLRLGSVFSHTAIVFGDTKYEATMLGGVFKSPNSDADGYTYQHTIEVSDEQYEKALAYAESQLGKDYDKRAILGFILGSKDQSEDNLFCSEFGRHIFESATDFTIPLMNLVTPGQLRLMIDSYNQGLRINS